MTTNERNEAAVEELAGKLSEMRGRPIEECREMARSTLEMARALEQSAAAEPTGELVLVEIGEGGEDGDVHRFEPEPLVIGREGDYAFPDDEFLSPQHVKMWREGDEVILEDMGSFNGTYVKVDAPVALEEGDQFLMGRQVLRLALTKDHTRLNDERMEREGVREMASPAPLGAATIQRVGLAGAVYDSYELDEAGSVLGRAPSGDDEEPEEGWADVCFSNDRFMSQRHCRLWFEGERWMLEDLGSSNGTWSKIEGRHTLTQGGHVFIGKQLFRIDRHA